MLETQERIAPLAFPMRKIILLLLILAVLGGAVFLYLRGHRTTGPLTGEDVGGNVADRRPIAVTIDNYLDARPQTGLDKASLVFETLAEGGITRFEAVFLEHDANTIGPVRSTRLYFNHWADGVGAIFGHDGGNVDALKELPTLSNIYNEDADRISGPFWRISSRVAPYNEYTSTDKLRTYAAQHDADIHGTNMSFQHKDDPLPFQRPGKSYIHVTFSYPDYNVAWEYNPGGNDYLRYMGGAPHKDAVTGDQLTAKNVIVLFTDESPSYDPYTPGAIHMRTEGTGKVIAYLDGSSITGTWSKADVGAPLKVLDSKGKEITLDKGNTWIEVVPTGNQVSVSQSL
jgi:hypothetical protein